jgi:L-fucose isomerase-like protein
MNNIKIEISVKEHIGLFFTYNDNFELIKYILYDCMSAQDFNNFFRWILNDCKESEMEFDKRDEVIKAYETLIKAHL